MQRPNWRHYADSGGLPGNEAYPRQYARSARGQTAAAGAAAAYWPYALYRAVVAVPDARFRQARAYGAWGGCCSAGQQKRCLPAWQPVHKWCNVYALPAKWRKWWAKRYAQRG
jgi:hypothetical protein